MLIVGANGGGSKAAYWTDLVIDCVFGSDTPVGDECSGDDTVAAERRGALFLTSSVSGGSVGVHHLLRHMDKVGGSDRWLVDAAGAETLSPTLGWGLVHDLPAFMLGVSVDPSRCGRRVTCRVNGDRAAVQEAALGGVDDQALLDAAPLPHKPPAPLTIFNGASNGQRVLLSRATLAPGRDCPADFEPIAGAVDGSDLLPADRDVPLTTAAVLSARFPGVAPAGRLGTAAGPEPVSGCGQPATRAPIQIRDGGYVENTGLLTIVDLLPAIDHAVASWETGAHRDVDVWPIVLSVDDDVPKVDDESHYRSGLLGMGEPTNAPCARGIASGSAPSPGSPTCASARSLTSGHKPPLAGRSQRRRAGATSWRRWSPASTSRASTSSGTRWTAAKTAPHAAPCGERRPGWTERADAATLRLCSIFGIGSQNARSSPGYGDHRLAALLK